MPVVADPNVLVGLATSDDAAVYRVTDDLAVVLTADYFTPVVDDPYEFGRIAVTNALSDVYAMGARPVLALNLVGYPTRTKPMDTLKAILRGGADQAAAAGVSIVGGHSIDDPEPKYGLCVMGLVNPKEVLTNAGAQVGDKLILTKPIGTGIIATAIKKDAAPAEVSARAIEIMTTLNGPAVEIAKLIGCNACTDITGFGLLGHLHEMTSASCVGARITASAVPSIEGVMDLIELDMVPGGTEANLEHLNTLGAVEWSEDVPVEMQLLLCDAQTAGGLLLSVPPEHADKMVESLQAAEVLTTAQIGEIIADPEECRIRIQL